MSHRIQADWFASARGRYLLSWEQKHVDHQVADIFGFNALQLGMCSHDYLRANRMPNRMRCAPDIGTDSVGVSLFADGEELPFESQSLDLVVLPHVLEFVPNPHQVLREVERVLVPEGHVLISGFNPMSLWGMRRVLAGHLGEFPWTGHYLSALRLKDWLSLLGFEHRHAFSGCFVPPVASEVWLRRWSFMETAGRYCWPFGGAVHVFHAVKKVPGMRLIEPRWRERELARKKAMVPAAHRGGRNPGAAGTID